MAQTKSMSYDHPTYTAVQGAAMGEIGGAATTQYAKFAAFTAMQAKSATLTVTTAGTATAHTIAVSKVSGTSTTALGTATLGTNVAGTTQNLLLTGVNSSLLAGDILVAVTGADAVGKAAISYEMVTAPLSNVTP